MDLWLGGPAGPTCPVEPNARQFLSANQCTYGWYTCFRPPIASEAQPLLLLYRIPKSLPKEDLQRQFPGLTNITCLPYVKSYKNKTWCASADLPHDLAARDKTVLFGKEISPALPPRTSEAALDRALVEDWIMPNGDEIWVKKFADPRKELPYSMVLSLPDNPVGLLEYQLLQASQDFDVPA